MKRVKVKVDVILEIYDEDNGIFEMQLMENSVSSEIEHLESSAYSHFLDGDFQLLGE